MRAIIVALIKAVIGLKSNMLLLDGIDIIKTRLQFSPPVHSFDVLVYRLHVTYHLVHQFQISFLQLNYSLFAVKQRFLHFATLGHSDTFRPVLKMIDPRFGIPSPGEMGRQFGLWSLIMELVQENVLFFLEHVMWFHFLSSVKSIVATRLLFEYQRLFHWLLNKLWNLDPLRHVGLIQFIDWMRLLSLVEPVLEMSIVICALQIEGYQVTWPVFRVKSPKF